jgi:GT2 family glycosyltransferase
MKLSVIIVNYNVKYFLEQCLLSVQKAMNGIDGEIIVVDNNSVDGSVEMLRKKFPGIKHIANTSNEGFSKANNKAISMAKGEYVLLLNPDTLVEEDTFSKIVSFADNHPDAGAVGVKMIDGTGKFLPESKRGLPTPSVAFYKISGLARLFPRSRTFGKYHLSYLDNDKIHDVDVLSGAFMLIRKNVLEKTGLLDEDYFMYGEDIDISYRIKKAGYKNYYFPETSIIHYKGESTKRTSVNYVFTFYRAMIIFARKHFSSSHAFTFSLLINLAIYFRAGAALLSRVGKQIFFPLADSVILYAGIYFIQVWWSKNLSVIYPREFFLVAIPSYIFIWLFTVYFSGGYDRPVRLSKIIRGIITGTVIILTIYALLPETVRYSRAMILIGTVWAILGTTSLRLILNFLGFKNFALHTGETKRLLIAGSEEESRRILSLLNIAGARINFIGYVDSEKNNPSLNGKPMEEFSRYHLGNTERLADIAEVYRADEIIFCADTISSQKIITSMSQITGREIEFKIAPPESMFIIGSHSVENPGELYVVDVNAISKPVNKRNKRLADIVISIVLLPVSPLLIFFQKNPAGFLGNIFKVLGGKMSWVGYRRGGEEKKSLPAIRKGVLAPSDAVHTKNTEFKSSEKLDMLYAKDYQVYNDLRIVLSGWRELGRKN